MHHHRRRIPVDWLHNWRYATEPTCEWALYLLLQGTELSVNSFCVGLKNFSAFGEPERRRRLPLRGKGIDLEDIDSAGEMIA